MAHPCFVCPIREAGYDIADYFTIHPRYGGNGDLADQARPSPRSDQDSLLHTVKDLIAIRRAHPELGPSDSLDVLHDAYPSPIFAAAGPFSFGIFRL